MINVLIFYTWKESTIVPEVGQFSPERLFASIQCSLPDPVYGIDLVATAKDKVFDITGMNFNEFEITGITILP